MTVIRSQCKDDAEYLTALRDDFAAAAFSGLASANKPYLPLNECAELAYKCADAMLAERDKGAK